MKYKAVKGMEDILPPDTKIWQQLEEKARSELEFYGFLEIRTPLLEDTSIFVRSIGEDTDIVTKEMYTFKDRKERSLTLRPEGTASIVRAYIEHSLDKISSRLQFYYIGPMFRSERPQRGRSRQFHQIGVEVFGSNSPYADAEVIKSASNLLKALGLSDFIIKINSLGCKKDKDKFAEKLKGYLTGKKNRLCEDCKERIKKNVLRVLDCKAESCMQVVREAPDILSSLCIPCKDGFEKLKDILDKLGIKYEETKNLVRGLDYYTGTVFEITHSSLGAQDAIGAGGRYDNLVKDLGGSDTAAMGYALGMERVIIALKNQPPESRAVNTVYIATLGDRAKIEGVQIAEKIKKELSSLIVLKDLGEASLKSQMRSADKNKATLVVILGEDELREGKVIIKNMQTKEQVSVEKNLVVNAIKDRLC
ncbi:MAG: histidine--tRNA ligase [Candidatus Omnitrophica bacterium]|nr:histidine--tRNA ligase [Candidatus Omnitrophota bacterium]